MRLTRNHEKRNPTKDTTLRAKRLTTEQTTDIMFEKKRSVKCDLTTGIQKRYILCNVRKGAF